MLINDIKTIETEKISVSYTPEEFPHFRLLPSPTEAGKKYCLFLYVDKNNYLILETGVQRYKAIQRLKRFMDTSNYRVFEIIY